MRDLTPIPINSGQKQSHLECYLNIIKYHGVTRGLRRIADQIFQNDLYDIINSTNFSQFLSGEEFYHPINPQLHTAIMHYQPCYTASVKKPLKYLIEHYPICGAPSTCFLDLGCGRGKALHITRSVLQHITLIGIELHPELL